MALEKLIKGFIIDTGPLLLHAFYKFGGLELVNPGIPMPDLNRVALLVERIFCSARKVVTTPYIIAEFHAIAERKAKLKGRKIVDFIRSYAEVLSKIEENIVRKEEILLFKAGWGLCFADSSLILSAKELEMPILSVDRELVNFCKEKGVDAFHVYYDVYLRFP